MFCRILHCWRNLSTYLLTVRRRSVNFRVDSGIYRSLLVLTAATGGSSWESLFALHVRVSQAAARAFVCGVARIYTCQCKLDVLSRYKRICRRTVGREP